jgi:hypothetical protein
MYAQPKIWKILGKLRCNPGAQVKLAKAILVLQVCEAKAG